MHDFCMNCLLVSEPPAYSPQGWCELNWSLCLQLSPWSLLYVFNRRQSIQAKTKTHDKTLQVAVLSCFSRVRLCDPMDCGLPGSSVHGIFRVRIPEWVAMASSRGSSWPRERTPISYIPYITSATWEAQFWHQAHGLPPQKQSNRIKTKASRKRTSRLMAKIFTKRYNSKIVLIMWWLRPNFLVQEPFGYKSQDNKFSKDILMECIRGVYGVTTLGHKGPGSWICWIEDFQNNFIGTSRLIKGENHCSKSENISYLFTFGCAGSSLMWTVFFSCGTWASHWCRFSCWGSWSQAQ